MSSVHASKLPFLVKQCEGLRLICSLSRSEFLHFRSFRQLFLIAVLNLAMHFYCHIETHAVFKAQLAFLMSFISSPSLSIILQFPLLCLFQSDLTQLTSTKANTVCPHNYNNHWAECPFILSCMTGTIPKAPLHLFTQTLL